MDILINLLSFGLILICLLLGLLVLIQLPKKEAGLGMAFGAGAVDTLLGAGGGSALTKITKWVGGIFLGLCVLLAWMNNRQHNSSEVSKNIRDAAAKAAVAVPAAPTSAPALNLALPQTGAAAATNAPAPK